MRVTPLSEIQSTKRQFLLIVTGEYLITGYFWVFSTLGSLLLEGKAEQTFFFTMFVFMLSNGVWEILTGWYADKFRRQLSMSAGFLACCVGFCFMGAAALVPKGPYLNLNFTLLVWYAGVTIWALGPALLSGAEEAWLVDRCNFFSTDPPEDVDDVFKRTAAWGVFAKSMGTVVCFLVLSPSFPPDFLTQAPSPTSSGTGLNDNWPVFVTSAIIAVVVSAWLFSLSRHLQEEYWSHPKYQTNESLFSFLGKGLRDLWEKPLRWFALSYVGVMSLNYVFSSTVWTYMTIKASSTHLFSIDKDKLLLGWAIALIIAELIGSVLSRYLSKWIDLIRQRQLRIPIAALIYLVPIAFLLNSDSHFFLHILIIVAFSFRVVYASVFGSLNTIGQLAIKSDERRAVLVSIASTIGSFFMSLVFLGFYCLVRYKWNPLGSTEVPVIAKPIENFWWVSLPCILMIALCGYLATRPRSEAR